MWWQKGEYKENVSNQFMFSLFLSKSSMITVRQPIDSAHGYYKITCSFERNFFPKVKDDVVNSITKT
jgi:hypothetical protein